MSEPLHIASLASFVPLGGQQRFQCPKCLDEEMSLSVRVDEAGRIHWRCFRAKCGYTGGPRGVASVFAPRAVREPRHYTRPTELLTEAQYALIIDKFGINPQELDGYSPHDDRFILGVYGPVGYNPRGVVAYSLSGATPKSLTYNEKPDEPFMHWAGDAGLASCYASGDIVVVEDWFSAEKVATANALGVALMGTHLSQEMVTEIAKKAASTRGRVWLALDQDAHCKALGYLFKYREQFPGGLFCWTLKKDLKYETTERITAALVDGKVNFLKEDA